jgi:hypothetical protein
MPVQFVGGVRGQGDRRHPSGARGLPRHERTPMTMTETTDATKHARGDATPPPPLDGELRFDEVTRKGCADDFGHIVHHMPEGVLLPGSAADVAKTIQWTAQRGCKFAPQGQRHSTFGRSQVPSGIVVDMSTLRYIGAVEGDRVVVEAGATWSDVLRATLAQGKTPPVLTEYLEVSVGGTLYPVSAFPLSKGEWRDHFGSAFGQLDAAKQQYDPGEILTPGHQPSPVQETIPLRR